MPGLVVSCLLNPWVRSDATIAKTYLKHYYGQRLLEKEFWAKLDAWRCGYRRGVEFVCR